MIVYHGSTEIIKAPDILHSYRPFDFGKGFYVTTNIEQAKRWAKRKADLLHRTVSYINVYEMTEEIMGLRIKTFSDDLIEWIDFVCNCRDGGTEYLQFDVIKGKVANDKVFRVVDLYHDGIWDKERALKEIKTYPNYDQIALITQKAIESLISYQTTEEV